MPAIVLLGAQWGDEGKGKATDLLGDRVDYVVRYQGGNNAGHTVVIGDQKYALHLLVQRMRMKVGMCDFQLIDFQLNPRDFRCSCSARLPAQSFPH